MATTANELEAMQNNHRLVSCQMQQEVMTCRARVDLPEYGIKKGQLFWLVASENIAGFAYLVTSSAPAGRHCTCKCHEFKGSCKHADKVNERVAAEFFQLSLEEYRLQKARKLQNAAKKVAIPAPAKKVVDRRDVPLNGNKPFSLMA
jgi:hypothetical protein